MTEADQIYPSRNSDILVIKNPPGALKVTWGGFTKEFSARQMIAGVNLAAEFLNNPFSQPFADLQETIRKQQMIDLALAGPFSLLDEAAANKRRQPEAGGMAYDEAVEAVVQFEDMIRRETTRKMASVRHSLLVGAVQ